MAFIHNTTVPCAEFLFIHQLVPFEGVKNVTSSGSDTAQHKSIHPLQPGTMSDPTLLSPCLPATSPHGIPPFSFLSNVVQIENPQARRFIMKLSATTPPCLRDQFPVTASDEALDLLSKMLEFSPETRISVEDALGHPFMQDQHVRKPHMLVDTVVVDDRLPSKLPPYSVISLLG